ncbi:two-component system, response regulator YesN [Thermanaeromonas toyohensis ToBE]|uniref:Stage 0 sporulation protein A homolog n=1 Tax=Thermanaeromonas toyohensis ToBE TaxID=698762 RepID=A0A1W1W204_9FIRM|nr:response regulator [Thermanaeromonas toyohensis]SMB99421.1 two-component system, response regulator YesN [Thermanaeromonas toyohensis ToBE]
MEFMKLLVVDDEALVRQGICQGINWPEYGLKVVGPAADGLEALEIIRQEKPDIALVDIRMPGMDGLELLKRIKELDSGIKVLILSAYDDFTYAQAAVKLGAFDYLLKPVEREELIEAVLKAKGVRREEREKLKEEERLKALLSQSLPVLREKFWEELLRENSLSEEAIKEKAVFLGLELDTSTGYWGCLLVELENLRPEAGEEEKQLSLLKLTQALGEFFKARGIRAYILTQPNYRAAVLVKVAEGEEREWEEVAFNLHEFLLSAGHEVSAGVGSLVRLNKLYRSRKQAEEALGYRFYLGRNSIIFIKDVEPPQEDFYPDVYEREEELLPLIKRGERERALKLLQEIFAEIKRAKVAIPAVKWWVFHIISLLARALYELGEPPDTLWGQRDIWQELESKRALEEVEEWVKELLSLFLDYLEWKKGNKNKWILGKIYEAVEKRYGEADFNLQSLARELYFTPNYLSFLFKHLTGENFTDYLTRFRIEKAKLLLKDPRLKIYDVASKVGYTDAKYFSKIFKKVTGLTPAEYRDIA